MTDIHVTIEGDKQLVKKFNKFVGSGDLNVEEGLDEGGFRFTQFVTGEVFVSRGGVYGRRWAPLNSSYAVWKARRYPGRPPLIRTGKMLRSFKWKAQPRKLELWNPVPYFKYHNEGWGVPQRLMMKIDKRRAEMIATPVVEDIEKQMKKAGLI